MSIDYAEPPRPSGPDSLVRAQQTWEDANEYSLRPTRLREYIGQEKAKGNLAVFIQAAKMRQEPLDHVLLHGPPGLGKTTLSRIIANEMNVSIRTTSGPAIERPGDLAALLTNLQENDILFIDEIHRMNRAVEEILYPAMEDYAIDIIIGKGPSANSIRLDLPRFTLIGATTRAGSLSAPLRDRFGVSLRLELYTPEELALIVARSAEIRLPQPGHSAHRQPDAPAVPGFCPGPLRRRHHPGGGRPGPHRPGGGPAGAGRRGPADAPGHCGALRRRAGGTGHPGRHHQRGHGDPGGHVRALPDAAGLPDPDATGPLRHPKGLRTPGPSAARRTGNPVLRRESGYLGALTGE